MIKHIVMFKLKDYPQAEIKALNASRLVMELEHLKKEIPQVKSLKTGINIYPENEYDVVLEIEFQSMNDLMIYQKHPAHQKVVEYLKTIRETKASIDYEF